MARILIRPEDLARLAQRFDAAADDLARSGRRLLRERHEVQLNPADETFPAGRFAERSGLIESNLRRLGDEFRLDAGLMAQTVDDAEFDSQSRWVAGFREGTSGGPVGAWGLVSGALIALAGGPRSDAPAPLVASSTGPGGLFAAAATSEAAGAVVLERLMGRLAGSAAPPPGGGALWSHIVGQLFEAEDDS